MKKDVSFYPSRLAGWQRRRRLCNDWCRIAYEDTMLSVFAPMRLLLPLFPVIADLRPLRSNAMQITALGKESPADGIG